MRKNHRMKICFAASSGGHLEQLLMLKPLMKKYDSFLLTEKTEYAIDTDGIRTYYVNQVNRKERSAFWKLFCNTVKSFVIFLCERPDAVVCTGVLAVLPMCVICKLFRRKVIFIESFAKVTSGTECGKLVYRFADQFYVQWESMLEIFPKAIYLGGIY